MSAERRDSPRATREASGLSEVAVSQQRSERSLSRQTALGPREVMVYANDGAAREGASLMIEEGWTIRKLREDACIALDIEECERPRVFALTNRRRGREVFDISQIEAHEELVVTRGEELVPFKVLACGNGKHGQLGLAQVAVEKEFTAKGHGFDLPHLVPSLSGCAIVQVACGREHSLFRSEEGYVFACGSNQHGQLGVTRAKELAGAGYKPPSVVFEPRPVALASCYACRDVAAGESHSVALVAMIGDDRRAEVFAWGCGDNGRLGTGTGFELSADGGKVSREAPADEFAPQPLLALAGQPVARVAAGGAASAAVTRQGRLFTWGKGANGCLGHVLDSDPPAGGEGGDDSPGPASGRKTRRSLFARRSSRQQDWDSGRAMGSLVADRDPRLFETAAEAAEAARAESGIGAHGVVAVLLLSEADRAGSGAGRRAQAVLEQSAFLDGVRGSAMPGPVLRAAHVDVSGQEAADRSTGRPVAEMADAVKAELGLAEAPLVRFAVADASDCLYPREVTMLRARKVLAVSFGFRHAVAIAEAVDCEGGTQVFAWGQGRYGELGFAAVQPDEQKAREAVGAGKAAAGGEEGGAGPIVRDGDGRLVASVGIDAYGGSLAPPAEATTPDSAPHAFCAVPGEVATLRGERVVQAACGAHHSLFLTRDGRVLACGDGRAGQLGLSLAAATGVPSRAAAQRNPPPMCVYKPTALRSAALRREGAMQIAAGPCSSAYITGRGVVYTWGRGKGGRLGTAGVDDARLPTEVDVAADQLVSFVAMGGAANGEFGHSHFLSLQYRRAYPSPPTIRKRAVEGLPLPSDPGRFLCKDTDMPVGDLLACCAVDRDDAPPSKEAECTIV